MNKIFYKKYNKIFTISVIISFIKYKKNNLKKIKKFFVN